MKYYLRVNFALSEIERERKKEWERKRKGEREDENQLFTNWRHFLFGLFVHEFLSMKRKGEWKYEWELEYGWGRFRREYVSYFLFAELLIPTKNKLL